VEEIQLEMILSFPSSLPFLLKKEVKEKLLFKWLITTLFLFSVDSFLEVVNNMRSADFWRNAGHALYRLK